MTYPNDPEPKPTGDDPRVLGVLYGVITFVLLIAMGAIARRDVWPLITFRPTSAVVDSTAIEVRANRKGDGYVPRVYFTYSVDGHTYHGTRVTPADLRGKKRWAEQLIARYQPQTPVTGYYDPEHPSRSFVLHSVGSFGGMVAIFGVWLTTAMGLVWRAVRKRRLTNA